MKYPALTEAQVKALVDRFGGVMDVETEIRRARDYAENFASRKYKNFAQFVRNWMLRAEKDVEARQPVRRPMARAASAKAAEFGPLSAEDLERIAADEDELPELRRMAREELGRV